MELTYEQKDAVRPFLLLEAYKDIVKACIGDAIVGELSRTETITSIITRLAFYSAVMKARFPKAVWTLIRIMRFQKHIRRRCLAKSE